MSAERWVAGPLEWETPTGLVTVWALRGADGKIFWTQEQPVDLTKGTLKAMKLRNKKREIVITALLSGTLAPRRIAELAQCTPQYVYRLRKELNAPAPSPKAQLSRRTLAVAVAVGLAAAVGSGVLWWVLS